MKTQTNQEQQEGSKAGFDQEVLKLDFNQLKDGLSGFVRGTVEEALNGLLQGLRCQTKYDLSRLYPSVFNGSTAGWGGVKWGIFFGIRRSTLSLSVVRKSQAPSSCNRPLRHAVCGRFLPSDIAPPLVRWCS